MPTPPSPRPFASGRLPVWLLAILVCAIVLFFFSPSWAAFALWHRVPEMGVMLEVRRGASVLQQIASPGAPVADPLHAVIQWRLLFPLIGKVLQLPPALFFGLAHVGCVVTLVFLLTLLRERGATWLDAICAAIILAAASWLFTSTGWLGYFDSWLALGLLIVAFGRSSWSVWAACLWTPWVDERFVPAAVLALIVRYVDRAGTDQPVNLRRDLVVPGALLAFFVFVRLGLLAGHSAGGATIGGYFENRSFLEAPVTRLLLGIWDGLRAGWLFVAAAVFVLWRTPASARRGLHAGLLALAVAGLALAGLATAQDYSRSMTMLLPAAVLGALLWLRTSFAWRTRALQVGATLALLLPAHHVMNDAVNPILYLYHELAAFRSPPAAAMPELHELRAIHHMERGEFAAADASLVLAIKLSPNPSSPAKQRGVLNASSGRWAEALRDFSLMVEHDSGNPESWFMRAQAQFALGQFAAARADLDRALNLAPDGWSARPDVTRFLAKLNQAR